MINQSVKYIYSLGHEDQLPRRQSTYHCLKGHDLIAKNINFIVAVFSLSFFTPHQIRRIYFMRHFIENVSLVLAN